jgi:hypothetical protein
MSDESTTENSTVPCPLCGATAERGCVMSGSGYWLNWFAGPPTIWKGITAGPIFGAGDPVGDLGQICGAYIEGIRCKKCDRIICEAVDPNRRRR